MKMDPETLLTTTMGHLEKAEVPTELRPVAFAKVFDLLAGVPGAASARNAGGDDSGDGGGGAPLEEIARKLNLDVSVVERVYAFENDDLELVVSPKRVKVAKAQATADIALLVTAGRQATGLDDGWTDVDAVRKACENYKRYDSSNFAGTIKSLNDDVMRVRGTGRDRKLGMTNPAWAKATALVESLTTGQ
jgi:hypothetical protein